MKQLIALLITAFARLAWVGDDYVTNVICLGDEPAVGDYLRIHSVTGSQIIWTNKP